MKSNLLRQMYCSSQDGLLCRKKLSTGIGGNGKCSLLDQDIETACSVTSAEKTETSFVLQQLPWVLLNAFLWLLRYFCFF